MSKMFGTDGVRDIANDETDVGDRNVLALMQRRGATLGGESFTFRMRSIDFERSNTSRSTAHARINAAVKVARDVSDRAAWKPEGHFLSVSRQR
jgi:hypothetical protein